MTKRLHLNLPKGEWRDSSSISVSILDQEQEIWRENRRVMIIHKALHIPTFAAVETKLRYDAPISVKNRGQAKYTSIDYSTAWDERLNDVVVFLPNGSRFVFWRGSSYIPFWAGKLNTGINYQWLEGGVVRKDAVDAVEPLQDKELRYSRVRVVESTPSRIHVRWTYQATDFAYKVWGDHATEDFYFYPDGFGTRVLTAVSEPEANYQVTEFIVVVPQAAYPLEILPARPIEMLYLNGEKISLSFPDPLPLAAERGSEVLRHLMKQWVGPPPYPAVYRIFDHKDDPTSAVYFSPRDLPRVLSVFKPFYDEGSLVVPAYWGDHWPLGRGALTGGSISDRIYSSPSHISLMGGLEREETTPLFTRELRMLDALGHSRLMKVRRWAWLIGRTNASDDELRSMAVSFSSPPSIRVSGGRIAFPSHTYERRSIRLVVDKPNVTIYVEPSGRTVNPVFELEDAPKRLEGVVIDGSPVGPSDYAWDGSTLWIRGSLSKTTRIDLNFAAKSDPEGGTTSAKPHEASSNLKSRQIASYD